MRIVLYTIFYLVLSSTLLQAQSFELETIAPLPMEIPEASGLEINANGHLWTHNDSQNGSFLYHIDQNGSLLETLEVPVYLKDLEDISIDSNGNFYLGDFGNNWNDRQNLVIYKFHPDNIESIDSIHFHYPDQAAFPPNGDKRNFDCESIIHIDDQLFIFSKNRGTSSYTRLYALPDTAGVYEATLIDSFDTGGWITGADYDYVSRKLVLLSEAYLWLFYDFEGTDFFSGKSYQATYEESKKEGIAFSSTNEVWIVEENELGSLIPYLYKMNIAVIPGEIPIETSLKISPNPTKDFIRIEHPEAFSSIHIFNSNQKLVQQKNYSFIQNQVILELENLIAGLYFLAIITENGRSTYAKFVIE